LQPGGCRFDPGRLHQSLERTTSRWAVSARLPEAKIIIDDSHVIKLFNERLSDLRRSMSRQSTDAMHKEVLKGTRLLLLKNPENLDAEKNEKQRLEQALTLNKPLATAYYMNDHQRRFWRQPRKRFATTFLDGRSRRAEASGISKIQQMSKTLAAHRNGLLACYDVMISNGPMEGTNNKIMTMKRHAFGFRDHEFFELKILAIHEMKYALVR
jgi:transposase